MFSLKERVYVLKNNKNKELLSLRHNSHSYVVGLTSKRFAKYMSNMPISFASVKVDPASIEFISVSMGRLYIDCNKLDNVYMDKFTLNEYNLNDFMKLPMNKNIGVVLGIDEGDSIVENEFDLTSIIVDPVYDIESYRENMNI